MISGVLRRCWPVGVEAALIAPTQIVDRVLPVAAASVRVGLEVADAGVHATVHVMSVAVTAGRVARNAVTRGGWRAGTRMHVPLQAAAGAHGNGSGRLESGAKRLARALARHPEVVSAYWDGGLARLVVQVTETALTGQVERRAEQLAVRYGLQLPDEQVLERAHPESTGDVRSQALALACDMGGIGLAVAARTVRLKSSPRLVTAVVTLVREDSRVRAALRRRLGPSGAELVLAAATAAAHGMGQSPVSLVLDAGLRGSQLLQDLARGAAFDAAHSVLCAPERVSVSGQQIARPALARSQGHEYADQAVTGSLVGAAAALVFTRSVGQAAEAVLAGSPKAARYGPAAFTAALGTALSQQGILVRDSERLRQLECVDTLVIHPDALHSSCRTVLEVHPTAASWDRERLWRAAGAALRRTGGLGGREGSDSLVELRPVPGEGCDETGLMVASAGGVDVGTVLVGWELDPLVDAVLDVARKAGLYVVMPSDASLGDVAALADEIVPDDLPLAEVVRDLREQGRVVMTVARVTAQEADGHSGLGSCGQAVVEGLRASHLAVAVTDERSAVVWGADVLALDGLAGIWRLLAAIPAARTVGRQSKTLAQAGAALAGLMVMTGPSKPRRALFSLGYRLSPVNTAAATALVAGWRAAVTAAATDGPSPRPRVAWHALHPQEAVARLAAAARTRPGAWAHMRTTAFHRADRLAQLPVFAPARLTARLVAAVRAELDDPLTPILAVGAGASAVLGAPVDALLVTGAMATNAFVSGLQRMRAQHALTQLAAGQRQKARRAAAPGDEGPIVDAGALAPGEEIELRTGDVGRRCAAAGRERPGS